MIKANELRVGNHLKNGIVASIEFDEILDGYVIYYEGFISSDVLDDLEPIPLTEVRFLDFGFEKEKSITGISVKLGDISIYNSIGSHWIFSVQLRGDFIAKIRNLHQLQNLFYALKGEELTVKN